MGGARESRALNGSARGVLALLCLLGSVACERPGQASATAPKNEIDVTSPGGARWPAFEQEGEEPRLTDADVERIATKLPHAKVPAISAQNPAKGPADAKVTLQVFSDFECPFCVRAAPTLDDIEERYRGRLRLVWRNYPLPSHERAPPPPPPRSARRPRRLRARRQRPVLEIPRLALLPGGRSQRRGPQARRRKTLARRLAHRPSRPLNRVRRAPQPRHGRR